MQITKTQAQKNIKIHGLVNFLSWIVFLVPVITLFYKYSGLSMFEIILVSNVATLGIWLFELPTSVFADTWWRTKSMRISVFFNFLWTLTILLFPSYFWFIIAAIFWALYWSFWSWTGQAFLEENLRITGQEKEYWKVIWKFMFYWEIGSIVTPLIATLILKYFWDFGYTFLALLDTIFAFSLIILTFKLVETKKLNNKFISIKHSLKNNLDTLKNSLKIFFEDKKLKILLAYRSLANHVSFFWIILLPTLSENKMPDWYSWIIISLFTLWWMFASKYAYVFGEKFGYNSVWVFSTFMQAIFLIIASFFVNSIWTLIIIYFIFNIFDWFWQPSWNHSLMQLTSKKYIATTRSIIFSVFALYTTLWKQFLSLLPLNKALLILWIFIIFVNLFLGKKIIDLEEKG